MQRLYKIFVTVPLSHTNEIINVMASAGAGRVGKYTHCSFVTKGRGSSKPESDADPYYGEIGKINYENEDKIEMICEKDCLEKVIEEINKIHPYENPTIDVVEIMFYTK